MVSLTLDTVRAGGFLMVARTLAVQARGPGFNSQQLPAFTFTNLYGMMSVSKSLLAFVTEEGPTGPKRCIKL